MTPTVFRNTELIYRNDIANEIADLGYKAMLTEGWEHYLGWRSPNFVYHAKDNPNLKLLLKNYKLSDDTAFRFSEKTWAEYPLTADKFGGWINSVNGSGELVNLFMDYETIGEHHWEDTGIFDFWRAVPGEILKHPDNDFVTLSEAADRYDAVGDYDVQHYLSWADVERDISAWMSNPIQHDAIRALYDIERDVHTYGDPNLIEDWRRLSTSDHFYYMCTKYWSDGDVHAYFSPYESPYEAFIAYMNVINDMQLRVKDAIESHRMATPVIEAPQLAEPVAAPSFFVWWKDRLRRVFRPEYH